MPMHAMQMTRAPTPQLPLGRAQSVLPPPTSSGDSTSDAARSSEQLLLYFVLLDYYLYRGFLFA